MTDPAIVMRKLTALRDHVERLRRRRPAAAETLRSDLDLQDALSMSLLVAVQTALDIAMHFAADRGIGIPATYAEAFTLLAQNGICDPETSAGLAKMAALSNRIAHGYASFDFARIWAELPTGIHALERFAHAISEQLGPG